jgi:hypothetical protein
MHKVDIDREVYEFLQGHARPFEDSVNDVLRRLLLAGTTRPPEHEQASEAHRRAGDLKPYLDEGLLKPEDELVHDQPRKGVVHRATVTADGWLQINDQEFPKVSPALKSCVGHEINGWANWTHRRSGRLLQDLRAEYRRSHT